MPKGSAAQPRRMHQWWIGGTEERHWRAPKGALLHARSCRRVWHVISRAPGKSIRQIARETGLATSTVQSALRTLKDVYGYIDYSARTEGGRTILVPFYDEQETR